MHYLNAAEALWWLEGDGSVLKQERDKLLVLVAVRTQQWKHARLVVMARAKLFLQLAQQ